MVRATYKVAVVGALGMVGTEMVNTLERRGFPVEELRPLDQAQYKHRVVKFRGAEIPVSVADSDAFNGVDIALFSAGGQASLEMAPAAVRKGAVVIDNSSAWRMDPACPLVVPEANPEDLKWHSGIIANPNCSTIQMIVALSPIHALARIKRIVISTYQAASGAGRKGYEELTQQAADVLAGREPVATAFPHPLAFNVIPQIDVFQDQGYTKEEWKLVNETRKILGDQSIAVTATCVRVPVYYGHSESVNVETELPFDLEEVRHALSAARGVSIIDDPERREYPTPYELAHSDCVYVGRLRRDLSLNHALNLWIVADNVRKGAALNAVQIAEALVERSLVRVP